MKRLYLAQLLTLLAIGFTFKIPPLFGSDLLACYAVSFAILVGPNIAWAIYERCRDAAFRRRKERFRALLRATSKIPTYEFRPQMGERLARYAGLEHNA